MEAFGVVVMGAETGGYPAAIRAHPTLAELWMEAAHALEGEPIHTIPKHQAMTNG